MAVIKKNRKKSVPGVSTASLPDIIFTLLFFFMVSAKVKDSTLKVNYSLPQAVDIKKLTSQDKPIKFHVGVPNAQYREIYGTKPRIQYKSQLIDMSKIVTIVPAAIQELPYSARDDYWITLKMDGEDVNYQLIDELKTELRKADGLKINYDSNSKTYE